MTATAPIRDESARAPAPAMKWWGWGDPGVEFASYTYEPSGKALNIKGFTYDTNGCAGFSTDGPVSFNLDADGKTATLNTQDKRTLTLHRVSK